MWAKLRIQASVRNRLVYDQSLAYLTESSGGLLIFGHSTEGPFTCRNRWNIFLKPSKSFLDTWGREQAKKKKKKVIEDCPPSEKQILKTQPILADDATIGLSKNEQCINLHNLY